MNAVTELTALHRPPVTIRASSFGGLFDCPARWIAINLEGRRVPQSGKAALGSAIHAGTAVFDTERPARLASVRLQRCTGSLHRTDCLCTAWRCGVSLDVYLSDENGNEVYWANITHNLGKMAAEAGIYKHLWRPDEIGITKAKQLINPLREGLQMMVSEPAKFKAFDAQNGWGKYDGFLPWIANYLQACIDNPDAEVRVSR